jgi:hypothetical protein
MAQAAGATGRFHKRGAVFTVKTTFMRLAAKVTLAGAELLQPVAKLARQP